MKSECELTIKMKYEMIPWSEIEVREFEIKALVDFETLEELRKWLRRED